MTPLVRRRLVTTAVVVAAGLLWWKGRHVAWVALFLTVAGLST